MGELNFFLNRETLTTAVPYKQTNIQTNKQTSKRNFGDKREILKKDFWEHFRQRQDEHFFNKKCSGNKPTDILTNCKTNTFSSKKCSGNRQRINK